MATSPVHKGLSATFNAHVTSGGNRLKPKLKNPVRISFANGGHMQLYDRGSKLNTTPRAL
jgi:hypothetical protein